MVNDQVGIQNIFNLNKLTILIGASIFEIYSQAEFSDMLPELI